MGALRGSWTQQAVLCCSRMNPSLGRNFEALDPLEWLARMSDPIPDPGRHRTLFYGEYANRVRGERQPREADSGTSGYDELKRRVVSYDLGDGLIAPVAALEDVIRSKEAANREKDRAALPTLRALQERKRQLKTEDPGDTER